MDKPTITKLGNAAREAIVKGVNAVYDVTKITLGPDSKSILTYGSYGREPRIIDDGHIGAQIIEPIDEFENLVAHVFREAAAKTNEKAGDGTTGTMVIAGKLINLLFSKASENSGSYTQSAKKFNTRKTCNELMSISKQIKTAIESRAIKVQTQEELEKIATVSVGDAELGKIIADMVWQVGVDGFVDVVEGFKSKLETEVIKGMRFPAKVSAKAFVNNPARFEMVVVDAPVFLTNYRLDNDGQVRKVLEILLAKNPKIILMAPGFSDTILGNFVQTINATKGQTQIYPVSVPSLRTDQFEDLAVYMGATFIDKQTGRKLENVSDTDLGFIEKLIIKDTDNREDAIATGGAGTREGKKNVAGQEYLVTSAVTERIKMLKGQLEETRVEAHKKLLERRIASISSAVGIIKVGAASRAELIPRKLKIEDSVYASKAGLEEGYVKGGGLCLKEIAEELEKVDTKSDTMHLLIKALKAPYEQIQANADGDLEIGDEIIDPAKVVRLQVEHAISVAANLISVGAISAEVREKGMNEGNEQIALAIHRYASLFKKQHAIVEENQAEMDKDMQQIYDEKKAGDTG